MTSADHAAMLELASELTPHDALRFLRQETGGTTSSALLVMMHVCQAHPGSALHLAMKAGNLRGVA